MKVDLTYDFSIHKPQIDYIHIHLTSVVLQGKSISDFSQGFRFKNELPLYDFEFERVRDNYFSLILLG
jgi:hypothetical protein